jgi:hypothetical protein
VQCRYFADKAISSQRPVQLDMSKDPKIEERFHADETQDTESTTTMGLRLGRFITNPSLEGGGTSQWNASHDS